MRTMTATAVARRFDCVLDELEHGGDAIAIKRRGRVVGVLMPSPASQTVLEALADVYRTLPEDAAKGWERDACHGGGDRRCVGRGVPLRTAVSAPAIAR